MRRLKRDPVPEADLRYLIDAATQAPTAENAQRWSFVVVTDRAQRRQIGELYRELGERLIRQQGLEGGRLDEDDDAGLSPNAMILVEHMGDAPAIIVACVEGRPPRGGSATVHLLRDRSTRPSRT